MKNIVKWGLVVMALTSIVGCGLLHDYSVPQQVDMIQREVRAVWIPTIYRNDYKDKTPMEAKKLLSSRLKKLSDMGCNMIMFQVRGEGDSWYNSRMEPTSRFLSSKYLDGETADWDPLAFVTAEGHRYGMEVHAWINPFRAWANTDVKMPINHPAVTHPEWIIPYGKQLIFDPGNPSYRTYLMGLISDIILRYDIDGIHIDDYFYPYPKDGLIFDDNDSFVRYGVSAGYRPEDRDMWRLNNINLFVYQLRNLIQNQKPWLRISVSPFGIYRNKSTNSIGSQTSGLQCYDDLYADVLKWVDEGLVDYVIPQVYWNFGNPRADYGTLIPWWSKRLKGKATFVVGQSVDKTMNGAQLYPKWLMSREYSSGNSWWVSENLWNNYKGISDSLSLNYQRSKALLPEVKGRLGRTKSPDPITSIMEDVNEDGHMILWEDNRNPDDPEKDFFYAVYAIPDGYDVKKSADYLVNVTSIPHFILPSMGGNKKYTFLVTTVNRFWQESSPMKITVKL